LAQLTGIFVHMKEIRSSRPVATWLMIGVGMIIIQVILGGITRLTGSGLSITEWDVITGTLPPMNQSQWLEEFHKYQQSPQYRLLNSDFSLKDFKFIFFWEWMHRLWGRLIGVVFAIPFIIFLVQKRFTREMITPLIVLFLLGGLQGAVGWIMVASGLTGDAVYVKPTRLALHFILAMVLMVYTWWFALKLTVKKSDVLAAPRLKTFTWTIIALLGVQFIFGALMAGYKAAPAAPTWPDINGNFIPEIVSRQGLSNMFENPVQIHFVHRMLAYLIFILVLAWVVAGRKYNSFRTFSKTKWLCLFLVFLQVALGVFTVLSSIHIRATKWNDFEWYAQLHQFTALLLLLALVLAAFLLNGSGSLSRTTNR
jgi:cytochrome c oxidase assembly protein subunit 15